MVLPAMAILMWLVTLAEIIFCASRSSKRPIQIQTKHTLQAQEPVWHRLLVEIDRYEHSKSNLNRCQSCNNTGQSHHIRHVSTHLVYSNYKHLAQRALRQLRQ